MTDSAVMGYGPFFPVRLVVFPEFAISCPLYETAEELLEKLGIDWEKASRAPARRLARMSGIVILSAALRGVAPRFWAASS